MNVAMRQTRMTREEFFPWAAAQDARYEFDGFQPVAMTGGTARHSAICQNLWGALRERLRGGACRVFGPDAGLAMSGDAVRYPDAMVTCTKVPGESVTIPGVVAVFEVVSPSSGRMDRIIKLREYREVPSILRYVILEYTNVGLISLERGSGNEPWIATTLTGGDTLRLPEIALEIPVEELYSGIDLPEDAAAGA